MVLLSGRDTIRGERVRTAFGVGQASALIKWPVLPVVAIAE
jgi:hypothetical protein